MNTVSAIDAIRPPSAGPFSHAVVGVFAVLTSSEPTTGASRAGALGCILVVMCDKKSDWGVRTIRPQLFQSPCDTMARKIDRPKGNTAPWTFLTNHAHVLICVHQDHSIRTRDIAARVGITERAVQRIISELSEAGYLTRKRNGRRNTYTVHSRKPLRHPVEAHCLLSSLLKTVENPRSGRG